MHLYINPQLNKLLLPQQRNFDYFMQLSGLVTRCTKDRWTKAVTINGQNYFIKQHYGVGWREILKNLAYAKLPVIGAQNEWVALQYARRLGLAVPALFAYGSTTGFNPAKRQSFVLMEALDATVTLDKLCAPWLHTPPPWSWKTWLIKEIAHIVRTMHNNGMNHSDLYLCHFVLVNHEAGPKLYLIDWHRAWIRNKLPLRWRIKDLAALYFSSLDIGLTARDYYRFMKEYHQQKLRTILQQSACLWQRVIKKGKKIHVK